MRTEHDSPDLAALLDIEVLVDFDPKSGQKTVGITVHAEGQPTLAAVLSSDQLSELIQKLEGAQSAQPSQST